MAVQGSAGQLLHPTLHHKACLHFAGVASDPDVRVLFASGTRKARPDLVINEYGECDVIGLVQQNLKRMSELPLGDRL